MAVSSALRARNGLFSLVAIYQKPYLPVEEQLRLLEERGMAIPEDREQALNWLRRIGYYRLSGYWYPFRVWNDGQIQETFREGTNLGHAFDLYVFDKRLRLLMLDAIERVEVALRVDIALTLGKEDPWAHRDEAHFNRYFVEPDEPDCTTRYVEWLTRCDELCTRSREDFARHFREKYESPFPLWIAIELWDFGTLSHMLNGLHDKHLNQLVKRYDLPRRLMLVSWVQSINFIRNVCAHHARLWNRKLINQPSPPRRGEMPLLEHWLAEKKINATVYAGASILQYLLRRVSPQSSWGERLKSLYATFPSGPGITSSGFPAGWEKQDLWSN